MNVTLKSGILALTLVIGISGAHANDVLYSKIKGKLIGILADGDFDATTYVTQKLAEDKNRKDTLTLISLNGGKPSISKIEVTNSVVATPESFNFSKDGRYAYVIERLGQRNSKSNVFRDLPAGKQLTIIDISNPASPKITDKVPLSINPESVRVSPNGKYVAVPSNSPEHSIVEIIEVKNGKSQGVSTFKLAELGVPVEEGKTRGGINATFVDWHPSSKAISVNLNTRGLINFYMLVTDNNKLNLKPWGKPVKVNPDPFVGRFMPDGKHYITADWGRTFVNGRSRLPSKPSKVSVILLDALEKGTNASHKRVSVADSDRSSEGIAVSPDGKMIATVNMRETVLGSGKASVSLLTFDSKTGTVKNIGNTEFSAMLPEGASFDASGKYLLVSVFQYHGEKAKNGGIEVFEVKNDREPLVHIGTLPSLKGTHYVEILK